MKTGKLLSAASFFSGLYNSKESRRNIFIVIILIINIILHFFAVINYKPFYDDDNILFNNLFITIMAAISLFLPLIVIVKWGDRTMNKQEHIKNIIEKNLLQLETKALRAQMNPHFIFNCINSIKSLIQQQNNDKAINYLIAFSKLLRRILEDSDNAETSLFEEIETCKIYTQLESLRFCNKITCSFIIDESLNLKSVRVPALILQPLIENAIWHGLMPKAEGGDLCISLNKTAGGITCIIDDNGIGRELSIQNKSKNRYIYHQSKGVCLTQNRLKLDNLLHERNATISITDKKDKTGKPTGTKIILELKEDV